MSSMGVPSRLLILVLAASLPFAVPVLAQEGGDGTGSSGGCGGGSTSGNCTSPSDSNSTSPPSNGTSPPPSNPTAPQPSGITDLRTTCDLVRPTGGKVSISVNPVLGLLTVDPGCVVRWIHSSLASYLPIP